jgi:hypothetical protein
VRKCRRVASKLLCIAFCSFKSTSLLASKILWLKNKAKHALRVYAINSEKMHVVVAVDRPIGNIFLFLPKINITNCVNITV